MRLQSLGRMSISITVVLTCVFLAFATPSDAQRVDSKTEPLADLWSAASPFSEPPPRTTNSISVSLAQSGDESTFLLNNRDQSFLMLGVNPSGPGQLIPLATRGWGLKLAAGLEGNFWIGGLKNPGRSIYGARLSDAYLAKINRKGQIIWEREYGRRDEKSIETLAALPPFDDVVVAGKHNGKTWIARIGADGRVIWEESVGLDRGASLVVAGNKILLAAFDAVSKNPRGSPHETYRVDVTLWTFDHNGRHLDKRTIREAITYEHYGLNSHFGRVLTRSISEAIYVFSNWAGGLNGDGIKSLAVTRVDTSGQIAWQRELPQTIVEFRSRKSLCQEHIAVLANDDPLVSCLRATGIQMIRLNAQTGDTMESLASAPPGPQPCRGFHKTLSQAADMSLWLFGADSRCVSLSRMAPDQLPSAP